MLHPPTAFVLSFALALTCGVILLLLGRQDRRQPAIASWGVAHCLGALALLLLALRGTIPAFASVQLGNALLAVSYGLVWAGARQFRGARAGLAPILAGCTAWMAACQIPAFYESLAARVLLMGFVAAGYYVAASWEFRPRGAGNTLRSQRLLIGILLTNAACYLLRIPVLLLQPVGASPMGHPTSVLLDLLVVLGTALAGSAALGVVALQREKEEREANTALREARDTADRASAEKTRFLAHMSHELRTPLNGVLGLAQALAQDPALPEEQRGRAAMLERAGRHLNALLNDVLDLSAIEAGRLELVPVPTWLKPLLEDVAGLARAGAEAKGVALRIAPAPGLPASVLCDPLRVRQILHNLLNNAVKFTPAGGDVLLSVRRAEEGGLLLTVKDDGPGVPEEFRDRLFQTYSRSTREAAKGDGTGLGLAISSGLASAMGGTIRFGIPPEGKGSIFEVWLPLPEAEAAPLPAPPDAPAPAPAAPGRRVLVVDDVTVNRLVLRAMLEPAGYQVTEARDGQAALDALGGPGPLPDVVLMDAMMPGMDGMEATRRIRALPGPASRLRILAVTAGAMPEQVAACLNAGMDGHVMKPVDRRGLLATLAARDRIAA
ncbi:response regulator [Roseomonas sp. SSH11]|uniref:histidine kinase n=1 Tax=Pararoseomonas baculiformis TaxID=2820812 RepID=A0ABS4ACN3_9PROT|nr:ATP-binding protein [Pararoseomonas baculiformis]MBP0444771.1 response regulator [Pararoseomonas baculiformis]